MATAQPSIKCPRCGKKATRATFVGQSHIYRYPRCYACDWSGPNEPTPKRRRR